MVFFSITVKTIKYVGIPLDLFLSLFMKPLEYSHIYVLESLRPGDIKTGTDLFNDVIRRRMMQKGLEERCELITMSTKLEFFGALEKIKQDEVIHDARPIIHFEMHGDENGLGVSNGEIISWQELQFFLLQINGICRNNLFVTMATCKGGYIYKAINASMWAPFWGFVGPFEEVTGDEVLANYSPFYDEFLRSSNFENAIKALHSSNPIGYSKFRFNTTEHIFRRAFQNYELLYLTPEMVDQRVESIYTECRPKSEFNHWADELIREYARSLILDEGRFLEKRLMRRFFMIDVFPGHEKYYAHLL